MSDRVRVCRNCYDYAGDGAAVVPDARANGGWRHKLGTVRCPGQEDDDTDDRAEPMWLGHEDAAYFGIVDESLILSHATGDDEGDEHFREEA